MNKLNNEIDKDFLYGKYQATADWRDKLHRKLAHKSLDIAEDEDVYVNNSKTGLGWKELLVLGLMTLAGLYFFQKLGPQSPLPSTNISPSDSEYEVRFFDKDGNPIIVPHISTKPK